MHEQSLPNSESTYQSVTETIDELAVNAQSSKNQSINQSIILSIIQVRLINQTAAHLFCHNTFKLISLSVNQQIKQNRVLNNKLTINQSIDQHVNQSTNQHAPIDRFLTLKIMMILILRMTTIYTTK
jgi:hypothetical protein